MFWEITIFWEIAGIFAYGIISFYIGFMLGKEWYELFKPDIPKDKITYLDINGEDTSRR